MATDFDISSAAANAAANAVTALANGGTLRIYSGTKPATPGDALSGNTLLVQLTFGSTAFGSASNGAATNNAISAVTASATGTASFFRAYSSGGTAVFQGTCGTADADLVLSSTSISSGGSVSVANGALTYTQPAG